MSATISTVRERVRGAVRAGPFGPAFDAAMLRLRKERLRLTVRHLHGPAAIVSAPDEAIVVAPVYNGERYIRSFVAHHTDLGVRHIVLLDNGSSDRTVELAAAYSNVTVLQSRLPYKVYKNLFREYLLRRFGRAGWCLLLDVDELFDYPRSNEVSLRSLLRYLNRHGYNAVVGYMLDMFSDQPLRVRPGSDDDNLRKLYPYYDLANLKRAPYTYLYKDANRISNEAIQIYWGGIRDTIFGTYDWITKHPLVRVGDGRIFQGSLSHDVYGASVADISCVLYHYKFLDSFRRQAERAVELGNYAGNSRYYREYLRVLKEQPDLVVHRPTSQRLRSVDELVDQGFLASSQAYAEWARSRGLEPASSDRTR